MRKLWWAALALPLAACVTDDVRWVRAGATSADFDTDKARCQYEATLGTPGSYYGRGMGNAMAAGISDGLRMAELQTLCMQARGWQRTVVTAGSVIPPTQAPPAPVSFEGTSEHGKADIGFQITRPEAGTVCTVRYPERKLPPNITLTLSCQDGTGGTLIVTAGNPITGEVALDGGPYGTVVFASAKPQTQPKARQASR